MTTTRKHATAAARAMSEMVLELRRLGREADALEATQLHDRWVKWAALAIARVERGANVVSLDDERRRRG